MNIIKYLKSVIVAAAVMSFSGAVLAGGSDSFSNKIEKQFQAIETAKKAKEISGVEAQSLKKEIEAIKTLYKLYWKDQTISAKEAKALNSKLSNSDVNLFRKKYD